MYRVLSRGLVVICLSCKLALAFGPADDLAEKLRTIAPREWKEYTEWLSDACGTVECKEFSADGILTQKSRTTIRQRNAELSVEQIFEQGPNVDGVTELFTLNSDYGFKLSRKDSVPWQFDNLAKANDWDALGNVGQQIKAARRFINPTFLQRESLSEIILKPYFKLKSITEVNDERYGKLVRMEFDYPHPYEGSNRSNPFNWVQRGTVWLDSQHAWVIVRAQVECLNPPDNTIDYSEIVHEFEENSSSKYHLMTRRIDNTFDESWKRKVNRCVREIELTIPDDPPKASEFRLSHYGFKEPKVEKAKLPIAMIAGVGFGLALLIGALLLRRRNAER